jgi:hypothetical protein
MMPRPPWHSVMGTVHHTHLECAVGMSIGLDHIRFGEGGKPLCDECARLEAEDEAKKRPPFSSFGQRTETAPRISYSSRE